MKIMKKINYIYIFGIIFILVGFECIILESLNISCLKTAKYKEIIESNVISLKVEKDDYWFNHFEISSMSLDSKVWVTKEEIKINGNKLSYQGRYSSDPGDKIKHTIISNDGVNWNVYESNKWNLVVGMICTLVGLFLVVYEKKKRLKKK